MKLNGITLESRGKEKVFVGDRGEVTRTVYTHPDMWRFYIVDKDGTTTEVYHLTDSFSIVPRGAVRLRKEDVKKAGIRAWVNGNSGWNWVYLCAGQLYIRYYKDWYGYIADFDIDRIEGI